MSDHVLTFLTRADVWALIAAVVGFFGLTGIIRQAPLGQATAPEPPGAPPAAERDRAVILVVLGVLLVPLGGYLALRFGVAPSIPVFAAGVALIQWVIRTHRSQRHESPTIRRLIAFAETGLTASLIAGVLLVGNVLAFRLGGRPIDLTHDQAFSLSTLSLQQVQALDRPVRIAVFFGNSERSVRHLDRVRQLVDLYHVANPAQVQVQYLNPFTDVREFEELAKQVPDVAASLGSDGMVISYGEGADAPRAVLGTRELFEGGTAAGADADRFTSTFRGEDVITSTLIRLREGKRTRIAFTTGHNEPKPSEADPSRPGYGLWRARLASVGTDVVEVNLLSDEVAPDISLLVIGGPKSPFQPAEVERIKEFLIRGGSLLVLVDNIDPNGLEDLLATYNVAFGPGIAADLKYHYANRPTILYAPITPNSMHPIVAPLVGQVALLQNAAPVVVIGPTSVGTTSRSANPGIIATPILRTSPESWAESDLQASAIELDRGKEQAGPLVVGVAATTRPAIASEVPVPRLVVFSTPTIADNRLLRTEATNIDLLMNAVSWLRGKPDLIGIAPKTHESLPFNTDPGLRLRLVMVPTLTAIIVIIGLGLTTWLARRD